MQVRSLLLVKLKAVFEDKTDISPELIVAFVDIEINLVENGSQVHWMGNYLEVVRAVVTSRVYRLAEKNSIMDVSFCEVEELRADKHERFTPFAFDFVGLNRGKSTFFWWITGNISVLLIILSTSR